MEETRSKWLEERRNGIGSSDAAAILGVSPWGSPLSVYAAKKGITPDKEETEAMYWGKALEEPIAKRFEQVTGWKVADLGAEEIQRHKDKPFLTCTLDRVVDHPEKGRCVLEIKTAGVQKSEEWDNGVPQHYFIQVQHQLLVTGIKHGYVAVLIGGQNFRHFEVDADEGVQKLLMDELTKFWEQNVQANEPPFADGRPGTAEALAAMFPEDDGSSVAVDYQAVEVLEDLVRIKQQIEVWEGEKERCENTLKLMLGGAARGVLPNGWSIQWKTMSRKGHFVADCEYRQFKVVKPRRK